MEGEVTVIERESENPVSRPMRRSRTRRRDAGAIRMLPRDAAALQWLGEQYGAQYDVLSVLLARLSERPDVGGRVSVGTVRQIVDRWEKAGWVRRWRLPGGIWMVPTKKALQLTGRPQVYFPAPPEWTPQVVRLPHTRAAAIVRLAYELGGSREGEWISDRLLYQERHARGYEGLRDRIPDAELRPAEGPRHAVEVELTVKTELRYSQILQNAGHARQWWVTWPESVERLKSLLLRAQAAAPEDSVAREVRFDVEPLPQVEGLPYEMWEVRR
jgi:hypothetical protein